MPKIITNFKTQSKEKINSSERGNFLSKNDLKTTFAYGTVAVMITFTLWGLLKSYYNQITK